MKHQEKAKTVTITIGVKNWDRLWDIKRKNKLKGLDQAISFLYGEKK